MPQAQDNYECYRNKVIITIVIISYDKAPLSQLSGRALKKVCMFDSHPKLTVWLSLSVPVHVLKRDYFCPFFHSLIYLKYTD